MTWNDMVNESAISISDKRCEAALGRLPGSAGTLDKSLAQYSTGLDILMT